MLPNLVILTVTYGDRYDHLVSGPLAVSAETGCKVIVVCNGVCQNVLKLLNRDRDHGTYDMDLIVSDVNLGSAGGFKAGLEYCQNAEFEYLLLLDDDNFLPMQALSEVSVNHVSTVSFFPRYGRRYMEVAAKGVDPYPYLSPDNSFLGLSIFHQVAKRLRPKKDLDVNSYSFPWGPYGGLLLKKEAVLSGILPKEDYFLYCDDTEYTSRLAKKFGLYMLSTGFVADTDESWNVSGKKNVISRLATENESWRVFYSVRNQSHFDLQRAKHKSALIVNALVFLVIFNLYAVCKALVKRDRSFFSRCSLVHLSIWRGVKGRLGNNGIGW